MAVAQGGDHDQLNDIALADDDALNVLADAGGGPGQILNTETHVTSFKEITKIQDTITKLAPIFKLQMADVPETIGRWKLRFVWCLYLGYW
jgi:hypothetical protein